MARKGLDLGENFPAGYARIIVPEWNSMYESNASPATATVYVETDVEFAFGSLLYLEKGEGSA
jgi:hypothetical protein